MTHPIPTAVIGVGYLGRFHAQKYAALAEAELVAVVDIDPDVAHAVARECHTQACTDYNTLFDQVEAVSIAVPTQQHFQVAQTFLRRGVHVLIEKPITTTVEQADALIALAQENQSVLQVGHLERFNPAVLAISDLLGKPQFIESHRLAPFNPRGTDVNVVLDLMIHDIDIIQSICNSPIVQIHASGTPVLTDQVDIANARIEFGNGCVANVTASRVSMKSQRKMRLFQNDAYLAVDFQEKTLTHYKKGGHNMSLGVAEIVCEERVLDKNDALLAEITAFLQAVAHNTPPLVSGSDGRQALETAIKINELFSLQGYTRNQ